MRYLMATYDSDHEVWPMTPPNVDDAPHAPWWHYDEDVATGGVDSWPIPVRRSWATCTTTPIWCRRRCGII